MAHWLFKSEPESFSWDDLVKSRTTAWDGVRNHQAANNMKAMKLGERGFFYHSGEERRIVGVLEVSGLYRPDPSDASGRFGMVEVKALEPVKRPVTLAAIKADPNFADFLLVRHSRLSVVPVGEAAWRLLCSMAGIEA
ncbi:MAG TPA: EVE domain-containing protein [Alphaproteobacteria bacterium]|nr:EVE domain-containing protein [Alphaproteobacteria bacterium]